MPEEYVMDDNKTCSPFILRKTYVEILPTEQIIFSGSSGGQDTIKFTLASNSDFWLADESYLKFVYQNTTTGYPGTGNTAVGGAPLNYPGINPFEGAISLSSIGANALFRMMEIKAVASGTLLAQAQFYNHQFGALQMFEQEANAHSWFGGVDKNLYETVPIRNCERWRNMEGPEGEPVTAQLTYDETTPTSIQYFLTFKQSVNTSIRAGPYMYSNPLGVVNVGDIVDGWYERRTEGTQIAVADDNDVYTREPVRFKIMGQGNYGIAAANPITAANNGYVFKVQLLTNNLKALGPTAPEEIPKVASNTTIMGITILNRHITVPMGLRVCDGNEHTMCLALKNSFFWYNWPLFLLKGGIEIILYLETGDNAMQYDPLKVTPLTATAQLTYTIKFPRLVARMSTPEPSIQRDFVSKWNSDMGLIYYCPQIVTKRITGNNVDGSVNLNLQFGKRSIRSIMWQISPSSMYGGNSISRCHDSFNCAIQSHVRNYQIQIGSHLFPLRRMEVLGGEAAEAYVQTRMAAPFQYYGVNGSNDNIYERDWVRGQLECADAFYWNSTTGAHASATEANVKGVKVPEVRGRPNVVDMSRGVGKGAMLTGVDASMASVDLLIDRNGKVYNQVYQNDGMENPGTIFWDNNIGATTGSEFALLDYVGAFGGFGDSPVYWCHAPHDHFIRLSAQGISVLN